jgi:adenylate cyclase
MPQLNLRRRSVVWIAGIAGVLVVVALGGLLDGPELSATNLAFRLRSPQAPTGSVALVAIDDQSFAVSQNLRWPWPRVYFAQLLDRLVAGGAKTVVFDVAFFEPEEQGKPTTYTVRGDSLKGIADRFDVTIQAIVEANGPDFVGQLCPGQELIIPTTPSTRYTVQLDSIVDIAANFQVDADRLMKLNQIAGPCNAVSSQLLIIPVASGSITYSVQAGDTLTSIASMFQVNPLAILQADGQPAADPLAAGGGLMVQFGDEALAASMRAAGNVVLVGSKSREAQAGFVLESLNVPTRPLREAADGFGLANIQADADGVVHSIPAWDVVNDQVYYAWPIVAASVYSGQAPNASPDLDSFRFGDRTILLAGGFIRVDYLGPEGSLPAYSAYQVVNGDLPLETFKDKIVLVGATSESLKDTFPAPFAPGDPMPGVEIMGHVIDALLGDRHRSVRSGVCVTPNCTPASRLPMLGSIFLAAVAALGLTTIRRPGFAVVALLVVMMVYAVAWLAVFVALRTEIPFVAPELALFLGFIIPTGERAIIEELEKRRVRGIFERFISPEMVEQLVERGIEASRGQRADLTILFSDIRGFTTISEKLSPEEVVAILNEYLDAMTEIILRHGGTVDKYEGDLVMAFFGAPIPYPDHARRALQAALDMRRELDRLRAKWAAQGGPAKFEMGIGLNTGEVFVGLLGSSKRISYTVIGDAVNLASRLQDLTKDLQWPLLISEFTYEHIQDEFDAEYAESRQVKGKTHPVRIYKVLGRKGAPDEERVRSLYA